MVRLACVVLAIGFLLPACSSGGDEVDFTFTMTPNDGGPALTVTIGTSKHEPETGACYLEIYDVEGSDSFVQFGPSTADSNCIGYFAARFEDPGSGIKYDFLGNTQRPFGAAPTSPLASGTWCTWDVASGGGCDPAEDSGTFVVIEAL